jgi:nitrogen fixation protein FixH
MSKSNGRIWPYAISISIILVFGACIATIMVAVKLPVEKSDTYMMGYHEANDRADEIIENRIAFDKIYKVEYITDALSLDNTVLKYRISDVNGNAINEANVKAIITRPNNHKNDQELVDFVVNDGVYTFSSVTLPLEGRWDVMAKVKIGENQRFYNVKADTRVKEALEY